MSLIEKRWGKQNRRTPITSAVVLAIFGMCLPARAEQGDSPVAEQPTPAKQSATPTATPPKSAPPVTAQPQLERLVVSANRRIERLEDVPQSITVLTDEYMQRNNVREFVDIVNLSPALSISVGTQVGTNSINLRGIGTTSNNVGIEGDVTVIVDDLPFAQPQQAFKDLGDAARIEVLKGPQSTMFGKSAIAGAVVITTKPIDNGPMKGTVSLLKTSDQEYRVGASLSGRITDDVGLRLYVSKTNFPGLLHNLTDNSKQNGSGADTYLAKLYWQPARDLEVLVTTSLDQAWATGNTSAITSISSNGVGYLFNRLYSALSNTEILRGITISPYNRDIRNDSPSGLNATNRTLGLRLNYLFPETGPLSGHSLTSISAFNGNKSHDFRDNDNIDLISTFYQFNATGRPSGIAVKPEINATSDSRVSSQEFRLTSPDVGAFRYLVGVYLARTSLDRGPYIRGVSLVKETNYTNYITTSSQLNQAIYGNTTWDVSPSHTLTAGLRVNRELNDYDFRTIDSLSSSAVGNVSTGPRYYRAPQHHESAVTGKFAYSYHFTPDIMAYTSASTGHKGVAYDMTSGANNINVFKRLPLAAEKATSYEAGFKANLWNNRATLNTAYFHSTYRDFQTSSTERFSDGSSASVLYSIPAIQTRGFEADGSVLLTRGLLLTGSVAYTRATIQDWKQAPCFTGATDCTIPNVLVPGALLRDGVGGIMPNAAKWKGSLGAEYRHPLDDLPYTVAFNLQMRSQSWVVGNISQDPTLNRPGYGVVDLAASISENKGTYKLSFGVKNLFDRHYAAGGVGGFLTFRPTTGTNITSTGWYPARDAFRYFSVRLDLAF